MPRPCRWTGRARRGGPGRARRSVAAARRPGGTGRRRPRPRARRARCGSPAGDRAAPAPVGSGPGPVRVAVRVGGDGGLDLLDDQLGLLAAEVHEEIGSAAEPVIVGAGAIDADGLHAAIDPPADHLVAGVRRRVARLEGDPRVYGEEAAPADGAGGVDLHHRLRRGGRSRGLAGRLARELGPVAAGALDGRAAGDRGEKAGEQGQAGDTRGHERTAYRAMTCGCERPSGLDERGVPEGRPADALDGLRNIGVHLPCLGLGCRLRGRDFLRCRLLRCWLLRHCLLRGALHCRFLLRHAPESTPTLSARSIAGWPGGGGRACPRGAGP